MDKTSLTRASREIAHAKRLIQSNPELVWGWGTPAGQLRAKRRAELIAAGARLSAGSRVLEIGCGTGLFTELFIQTGAQLIAVDISSDLLEKAKARGLPERQVQFLEKRFEDCAVDGPFDAVVGSSVLHHLDIQLALARIYELLTPGGIMSFAEPNMLNPQILVQKNISWIKSRMGDSPDETAFIRGQLRTLLRQFGFEDVNILPFDWLHPATPRSLIKLVYNMGLWFERIPLLCEFAGSLYIHARRPS